MNILLIGIGNPHINYENTPHNIGFAGLNIINKFYKKIFYYNNHCNSYISFIPTKWGNFILAKPSIFINLSGIAVKQLFKYFSIKEKYLWILHDDINIKVGKVKISRIKNHGGHNGIKNILKLMFSNIFRIRIGILPYKKKICIKQYVLNKMNFSLKHILEIVLKKLSFEINSLKENNTLKLINFSSKTKNKHYDRTTNI